jgi:flagellar basal-body rod protein FlgG
LANSNTAGFKSRRPQFQDLMYQTMVQPGAAAGAQTTVPTGLQLGLGTRAASNEIVFTQGNFTQTSNPLDLVIQGNGFFQVRTPNGDLAYTRAGQFQLNRDGSLVDANGNLLEPQITLPQNAQAITIANDGTVSYTVPGQTAAQTAGQIQLATFINPAGMNSLGQNLYQPTNASGDPIVGNPGGQEGLGTLLQGYTEQSNVSVVDEFVNLIVSQRAYEANSKVIKAADEMYQMMNNVTR